MHASCRARGRLDIGRLLVLAASLMLSGCMEAPHPFPAGAVFIAALALLLTALLAFLVGSLRARRQVDRELRHARQQGQTLQALRSDWLWQTDASGSLTQWRPPAGAAPSECRFFAPAQAALQGRLQARLAFDGLQLLVPDAEGRPQRWLLRGQPQQDDLGDFAGFVGTARPLPEDLAAQTGAALVTTLSAWPSPAVVAMRRDDGHWQLQHANAPARALWVGHAGTPTMDELAGLLPAAAGDLLRAAMTDGAASAAAAGWKVERFLTPGSDAQGLVLTQVPEGTPAERRRDEESDTFSFTASHDLRAPIRVVEGFTRIVKEDYGHQLDRVGNDHLDRVLGAAARMNLMIDALLTLARLSQQPLARQPVNLSQLAGYIVDELRRAHPEREVQIDIQPGLTTTGDPTLLRLVLENLLGNAWKYSARTEQAQISLATTPHGSGLAYVVRDNGAGFDMRSADRLFGLFQRLHSASDFPGHGVGLASVRRIVHRHGGEIWAEAEPGRGAAFFFTLAA